MLLLGNISCRNEGKLLEQYCGSTFSNVLFVRNFPLYLRIILESVKCIFQWSWVDYYRFSSFRKNDNSYFHGLNKLFSQVDLSSLCTLNVSRDSFANNICYNTLYLFQVQWKILNMLCLAVLLHFQIQFLSQVENTTYL